jgi:hypothetical protein
MKKRKELTAKLLQEPFAKHMTVFSRNDTAFEGGDSRRHCVGFTLRIDILPDSSRLIFSRLFQNPLQAKAQKPKQ